MNRSSSERNPTLKIIEGGVFSLPFSGNSLPFFLIQVSGFFGLKEMLEISDKRGVT